MSKYYAEATRRNLPGKPDYQWTAKYTNGNKMIFDSEEAALSYAQSACDDPAHSMYNPRAVKVESK